MPAVYLSRDDMGALIWLLEKNKKIYADAGVLPFYDALLIKLRTAIKRKRIT